MGSISGKQMYSRYTALHQFGVEWRERACWSSTAEDSAIKSGKSCVFIHHNFSNCHAYKQIKKCFTHCTLHCIHGIPPFSKM